MQQLLVAWGSTSPLCPKVVNVRHLPVTKDQPIHDYAIPYLDGKLHENMDEGVEKTPPHPCPTFFFNFPTVPSTIPSVRYLLTDRKGGIILFLNVSQF